jgi:hypothetical protein
LKTGLEITAADIPADGFGFAARSERKDLDTAEYGLTLSTVNFVFVIGDPYQPLGAPIVAFKHAYWWDHRDLWVVKRER